MISKIQKLTTSLILVASLATNLFAEVRDRKPNPNKPRIVVGLVVDQMCWDYLHRFNHRFGNTGFRRLLNEGFSCDNTRINYIPAITAIGHASLYTGTVPSIHGIAGNSFRIDGKNIYCTEDRTVQTVGAENGESGQMSPRNMLTTTITDELRIASNFRSRVIGVALKDRASILPAGHSANAAYWFDDKSGNFITSTYYMEELPRWVKRFNDRRLAEKYLRNGWKPIDNMRTYTASQADANDWESPWGDTKATLPLDTRELMKREGLGVIRSTPMGNTLTLDMAIAAIEGEALGMRPDSTDFLAVSLSSTDYIGHRYATFSVEIEDTYTRLDQEIGEFLRYLDNRYGRDGYLFYLTADHAAAHNTTFLRDKKLPGRVWRTDIARTKIDSIARAITGSDQKIFERIRNHQVFFNESLIDQMGVDRNRLYAEVIRELERMPGVAYAVRADLASVASIPEEIRIRIINGYNRHRSGSIFVVMHPGWDNGSSAEPARGTGHAVWAPYDTHIPLIFMGHGIKPGRLLREVHITDLAATLAFMLRTQLPSGCIGKPIVELFDPK